MNDFVPILQHCILFCNLDESTIMSHILPAGKLLHYAQNTSLISSSDTVNWFGVILQGRVQISQIHPDGKRNLMGIAKANYVVGADLICTKSRRSPYDAIASEDTTLLRFSVDWLMGSKLEPHVQKSIWQQLMTLISQENMRKHYRLAILSQKSLRSRILTYLTMQARRLGTTTFEIPFNREELADFLCVNRSALSHELKQMEKEGILSTRKNRFTIYQPADKGTVLCPPAPLSAPPRCLLLI